MNPGLDDPLVAKDIDTRVVAYLWFNPVFAMDDPTDPEIDILQHLQAELPLAIVFFGDQDEWKKHSFFNNDPWRSVTLIGGDQFLMKHGLLTGEPTLKMQGSGGNLVLAP